MGPTGSQVMGGGWHPMGAEVAGQLMDSSTTLGTSAMEGRPCLVVWWRVWGVGEGEVTSWEMRAIEGARIQGCVQPGGAPGGTGMVNGMDWVSW